MRTFFPRKLRRSVGVIAGLLVLAGPPLAAAEPPRRLFDWTVGQHLVIRRYLKLLDRTIHDLHTRYPMPRLLMPVLHDLFARDLVQTFEWKERGLYAPLAPGLDKEQQRHLAFLVYEHDRIRELAKRWEPTLAAGRANPASMQKVEQLLIAIAQLLNRHIVLEERNLLPVFDRLTPAQEQQLLQGLLKLEQRRGPRAEASREAMFMYLEGEFIAINGRVW